MGAVKVNVPQVFYVDVRGKKWRRTNSTEKKSKGRRTNDGEKVNKVVSRRNFLFFLWLLLPANNAVMYIRNVQKILYFIESADSWLNIWIYFCVYAAYFHFISFFSALNQKIVLASGWINSNIFIIRHFNKLFFTEIEFFSCFMRDRLDVT